MLIKNLFFHIWFKDSFSDFIGVLSFCSQLGINKKIKIEFYFFVGYIPCGDIGLRLDIYERLSALVRNEAKKTKFKITEEMLSIAGATKDNLKDFITNIMKYDLLKTDNSENDNEYF